MGGRGASGAVVAVVVGIVIAAAAVLSSPAAAGGLGREAAALVAVRAALHDPGQVLRDWDPKSGDPCRWSMVTCYGGHVQELSMTQQNLSGTLSPAIGRLRSLRYLSLHQNAISGPIPETIGRMKLLQVLDLSNNQFNGSIPSTLGNLVDLHYLKLNNNSLSGPVPDSLATARMITTLDISFNNLSGPRPTFLAWNAFLDGNPLLISDINCKGSEPAGVVAPLHGGRNCSESLAPPVVVGLDYMKKGDSQIMDKKVIVLAIWMPIACILLVALVVGAVVLIWHWRGRQRVFAVADDDLTYAWYIQHYLLIMVIIP
ncbi:unnamed protein product [Urochloa humidicola]